MNDILNGGGAVPRQIAPPVERMLFEAGVGES
jgi:hypothetical protein